MAAPGHSRQFRLAWSWSRLNDFEGCPRRMYWKSVAPKSLRCPPATSPQMDRGKARHKNLEGAVINSEKLHPDIAHVKKIVDHIRAAQRAGWSLWTEQQLALTEGLVKTGWFDSDVWLRVVYDIVMIKGKKAKILDWKTGKNSGYSDQLAVSAFTGFAFWPLVDEILTSYVWVDHRQTTPRTYKREQFESLEEEFRDRSELIQIAYNSDGDWQAKPSDFNCKWCPCKKHQCKYSRQGD